MPKFKSIGAAWNFVQGIWLTFVAAALMHVFVAHLMINFRKAGYGIPPMSTPFTTPVMYFFHIQAIICLVAGIMLYWKLPGVFFRRSVKKAAGENEKASPEQSQKVIIKAIWVLPIIIAAFFLACEVYGVIPVMMGADFSRMLPFAGASLVALIVFWPRRRFRERIIAKIRDLPGIDATAITPGSDIPRRASRMKIVAFSLIVIWWLIHIFFSVILPYAAGYSSKTTIPDHLVTIGLMIFWGLLAWRFQKFGGISLTIFWSFMFVGTTIGIIRDGELVWQLLAANLFMRGTPIAAGILFYLDYRRQSKAPAPVPASGS